MTFKIALIGYGSIGSEVASALNDGKVAGAQLIGVVVRTPRRVEAKGVPEISVQRAIEQADLIIECAGPDAVRQYGPRIIEAGTDFFIVSVGALADERLRGHLTEAGPGRLFVTNGAIGGLDLLGAVTEVGEVTSLRLTTRKLPETLIQPWMGPEEQEQIRATEEPLTLHSGDVAEAIAKFPNSLNVAVALAHTTNMWSHMEVHLIGDPGAEHVQHRIEAQTTSGAYDFSINNHPSTETATTSGVVAGSLIRGIRVWGGQSGLAL